MTPALMTPALWTFEDLLLATRGSFSGLDVVVKQPNITNINFDSRAVKSGDIFLALKGERDGHDFVPQAFAAGASLAICKRPIEGGVCLLVADVQFALEDMAVFARDRALLAKRGAVTGSVGKTSVTQMVMAGLRLKGHAHSAIKSFNNHIGVPLTLARMPRDTKRAVFEIGMNHAGEIGPLAKFVAPDVALITTVGAVHTENFVEGELGVARAKAEIFEGMKPDSLVILNADNVWYNQLSEWAYLKGLNVAAFGAEGANLQARLIEHEVEGDIAYIKGEFHGKKIDFSLQHTGKHQALNALSSLLMLEALDVDLATSLAALEDFAPLDGRGKVMTIPISRGEITLIDESYNANPMSMRATINALGAQQIGKGQRKIVVLTDMLELGADEDVLHAQLYDVIEANDIDKVYCAGPLMQNLWKALPMTLKGGYALSAAELIAPLREGLQGGDIVMVKGSNGSKAHLLVQALLSE